MDNSVSAACRNYFNGFQDVSTFKANNSCKNALGLLKIISYFTVVIPLFLGVAYGVSSLAGRVAIAENSSTEGRRIPSIYQRICGRRTNEEFIDRQLDELFSSSSKTTQVFTIDGYKIEVIFNPKGELLEIDRLFKNSGVSPITTNDQVVLVSDKFLQEAVFNRIVERIIKRISRDCTYSFFTSFGKQCGQSTFSRFFPTDLSRRYAFVKYNSLSTDGIKSPASPYQ